LTFGEPRAHRPIHDDRAQDVAVIHSWYGIDREEYPSIGPKRGRDMG